MIIQNQSIQTPERMLIYVVGFTVFLSKCQEPTSNKGLDAQIAEEQRNYPNLSF